MIVSPFPDPEKYSECSAVTLLVVVQLGWSPLLAPQPPLSAPRSRSPGPAFPVVLTSWFLRPLPPASAPLFHGVAREAGRSKELFRCLASGFVPRPLDRKIHSVHGVIAGSWAS